MNNKFKNIFFLQCAIIIYSFSGIFSKKASQFNFLSIKFIFYYGLALMILFLYAIIWQQILKKFPLNVAYANKGILPLITMFWGWTLFNEKIKLSMIFGIIIVVLGIVLVVTEDD